MYGIILLIILILIIFYWYNFLGDPLSNTNYINTEYFLVPTDESDLLNPYSCILFKSIVNKQQRWNDEHQQRVYSNYMAIPYHYKE